MNLLIAGAGGFAKECIQIVRDCGHTAVGCIVPADAQPHEFLMGVPIFTEARLDITQYPVLLGMGHSWTRRKASLNYPKAIALIHPSVIRGEFAELGEGTIICIGGIITENLSVGRFALLNMGVVISHDAKIGDYCVLSPRVTVCGSVEIGEGTEVGAGTTILPDVKIGKWSTIGAGAVVTQDIPDNATAVGIPAKVIKTKPEGWHLA